MKITYNKFADAMYVYVGAKRKSARTIEINDSLLMDVDKTGGIVGFEILNASSRKGMEKLKKNVKSGIPIEFTSDRLVTV